jgi:hypothetical protein
MEVGQGQNWGCSAKKKNNHPQIVSTEASLSLSSLSAYQKYCFSNVGLKHNRPLWVAVQGLIRPTPYTYNVGLILSVGACTLRSNDLCARTTYGHFIADF